MIACFGRRMMAGQNHLMEFNMPVQSRFVAVFSSLLIGGGAAGLASCAADRSATQEARLAALTGENVVTFRVDGMACRNCANEIARELEEVPGVRAAMIDFDSATAKVALDADPSKAASMEQLHAAVEHWRAEHFAVKEDPNCLDPAKREEIQKSGGK